MTTTLRDTLFISTDAHVTEPIELYHERIDARLRDRAPRIVTQGEWRVLEVEGLDPRKLMNTSQLATAVVGDWKTSSRLRDQQRDGVSAEVIFPTFALQACFASDDPELQLGLCRAYNDWAAEVLNIDHRLLPVGLVPMLDLDDAANEATRLAGLGFRALFLPARVPTRPYNDPSYDRFWALAQELGLPLTFHSGTGHEPRVAHGPGAAVMNYLLGAQLDGPMVLLSLSAGGALDRYPGLRVITVETGASWLAWVMTQADLIYQDHHRWARPKLSLKPSELIRRQGSATFMDDPVAINNRHVTGLETLMWGNDYPHPEGTWPASQEICARQFADVDDNDLRAIVGGNAARVFGFSLEHLASATP